jgi:hypothetical protein
LVALLVVSTHAEPHVVSVPQLAEHAPSLQTSPAAQTFPQAPQLTGSEVASTQALPHSIPPLGHAHAPPLQSAPVGQAFPQAPQLAGSDMVSTHLSPHAASPPEQAHAPFVQLDPGEHAASHDPQCAGSAFVSTHLPVPHVSQPASPPPLPSLPPSGDSRPAIHSFTHAFCSAVISPLMGM